MSLLKRLFGNKSEKNPTAQEGIQRLRDVEGMLNKKSEFLERKIEEQIIIAKENSKRNKRGMFRPSNYKLQYYIIIRIFVGYLYERVSFFFYALQ